MPEKAYKYPWKEDEDFIKALEDDKKLTEENLNPFEELKIRMYSGGFMNYYNEEKDSRVCELCGFGKQRTSYWPKFQHKDSCFVNKYRSLLNSIGDMIA